MTLLFKQLARFDEDNKFCEYFRVGGETVARFKIQWENSGAITVWNIDPVFKGESSFPILIGSFLFKAKALECIEKYVKEFG